VCNAVQDSCASDELWLRMCAMLCKILVLVMNCGYGCVQCCAERKTSIY